MNSRIKPSKPMFATGKYLGPGSYDPHFIVPNYKFKPSANFLSSGPRSQFDIEMKKKEIMAPNLNSDDEFDYIPSVIPGPGAYYNSKRDTSFRPSDKNFKYQLFNSSVPRFDNSGIGAPLGPGTYNIAGGSPPKNSHNQKQIGFNSESKRKYELGNNSSVVVPGPGAYQYPYEMSKVIKKKILESRKKRGRNKSELPAIAKSDHDSILNDEQETTKHFPTEDLREKQLGATPGPGSYHKAHQNPKIRKGNNLSMFSSNLERFQENEIDRPPIGTYETNQCDIGKKVSQVKKNAVSFFFKKNIR